MVYTTYFMCNYNNEFMRHLAVQTFNATLTSSSGLYRIGLCIREEFYN